MTAKGRKRRQRTLDVEPLLDELSDDSEDESRDFAKPDRNLFESKHGPVMGDDGDDNPDYTQPKPKMVTDKLGDEDITKPDDIIYPVVPKPTGNPAGELVEAGHGFIVNDPRSRPWKTAKRTHCAHCGDKMQANVSGYKCEFDPEATEIELAFIGFGQGRDDRLIQPPPRSLHSGCQCSGCRLRWLVKTGNERGVGQPRKYCSKDCGRWANTARNAWKRAVASAEKRGEEPPPEPEDKGIKFVQSNGPRSNSGGSGGRYISSTGNRLLEGIPRA